MQNIIEIEERENRLYLKKNCKPIIAGNSNYFINFTFSEDWNKCLAKTAYFVVEGRQIPIMFENDVCAIPAMPEAECFFVFLVASPSEGEILSSSPIKLNLEKNPSMGSLKKIEPFKSYYADLLGAINKVQHGDIKVKNVEFAKEAGHAERAEFAKEAEHAKEAEFAKGAEHAQISDFSNSQVSKTGDEEISGRKNFLDVIEVNGESVLCSSGVSNPNLLINGDFKINQRNATTYSTANKYTVDRWKLVSGTVEVKDNGILLNGVITQTFENAPNGVLTASADQTNGTANASYENGVFTLSAENVLIGWAKLEVGSMATKFSPKMHVQEMADCYRYYYRTTATGGYGRLLNNGMFTSTTEVMFTLNLPTPMRISPTIIRSGKMIVIGCYATNTGDINSIRVNYYADKPFLDIKATIGSVGKRLEFTSCFLQASNSAGAYIELDAEIY